MALEDVCAGEDVVAGRGGVAEGTDNGPAVVGEGVTVTVVFASEALDVV